jgi:hypothetical protein
MIIMTERKIYYSHSLLIDVNWCHETSSVRDLSADKSNFSIFSNSHCKAYNFINSNQKVAKCDEKQWKLIRLHYHATRMAGRRNWACKHGQCSRAFSIVNWPGNDDFVGTRTCRGSVYGSNRLLAGDDCINVKIQCRHCTDSSLPTKTRKDISQNSQSVFGIRKQYFLYVSQALAGWLDGWVDDFEDRQAPDDQTQYAHKAFLFEGPFEKLDGSHCQRNLLDQNFSPFE